MNLANKITLFRVFLVPIFVVSFILESPGTTYISAIIFVFASLTDTLDGYIARSRNLVTNFGKFVDPLADKVLTSAALILLVGAGAIPSWVVILIVTREFTISGFRIIAASEGVTIAASPWGKLKTISQLIAIVLLLLGNFPFNYLSIPMDQIMLYIALILTVISGVDYIVRNIGTLNMKDI
ncbi:CDP-diacylglycerol--glycerol-3-phosphate 3-phosphatidyltransferase [Gudongella sp. SC589]|jgi:CDP-diacylglycerol--glycerol-3-phosphate 3-phosphatidyltransferase|uniref:CDP-diacylglycerol--glycerol-3-phosphate 3-phosphatidyltransferase n=1 Tax=Gudongella sp. SC589 TaxID=3385990 RepID=UPI0039048E00